MYNPFIMYDGLFFLLKKPSSINITFYNRNYPKYYGIGFIL